MTEQLDDQDGLIAGIFGDFEYAQPRTAPKEFMPWHKPRKQFVRRKQWSALLRRLYKNRGPGDPLRYLGLPGTDLIDLRYLHKELCHAITAAHCASSDSTRKPSPETTRTYPAERISLDEVRRLANVDPNSPT